MVFGGLTSQGMSEHQQAQTSYKHLRRRYMRGPDPPCDKPVAAARPGHISTTHLIDDTLSERGKLARASLHGASTARPYVRIATQLFLSAPLSTAP